MDKKLIIKIAAIAVAVILVVVVILVAAKNDPGFENTDSSNSSNSLIDENVDPDRYQLYVSNYDGGFGSAWLEKVKIRYEELHKNDVYETANGTKTGIQIMIKPIKEKAGSLVNSIKGGANHVYFTEFAYYYELYAHGVLGDITDAVEGDLSVYNQGDAQGTTIKSKLTEQQEQYYNIGGKYYGIPHYAANNGIIYNRRLFNNEDWYFALNPVGTSTEGKFISDTNPTKSAGPDGVLNTSDDGLPATYEEFFTLCKWIDESAAIPVILNGIGYESYITSLVNALSVDHNGYEESLLNYTLNGTSNMLVKMNENGTITKDGSATQITVNNAYELARQEGKAYALQFAHRLLTENESGYLNDNFDSTSFSHLNAQSKFIRSEYEGEKAAMLIDGIWWQSEATQAFIDATSEFGAGFSKMDSDFAWMPFPHATQAQIGQSTTIYDSINSMCFMKPGLTGVEREVAIDFIKFCNTNESLVEFTLITDTPKALNYSLSSDEMEQLTPFAISLFEIRNNPTTKIVYPYATNDFYKVNQRMVCESLFARIDGREPLHPASYFINPDDPKSAYQYFNGMYEGRQARWPEWLANISK